VRASEQIIRALAPIGRVGKPLKQIVCGSVTELEWLNREMGGSNVEMAKVQIENSEVQNEPPLPLSNTVIGEYPLKRNH
jgi:hypothetical protein